MVTVAVGFSYLHAYLTTDLMRGSKLSVAEQVLSATMEHRDSQELDTGANKEL